MDKKERYVSNKIGKFEIFVTNKLFLLPDFLTFAFLWSFTVENLKNLWRIEFCRNSNLNNINKKFFNSIFNLAYMLFNGLISHIKSFSINYTIINILFNIYHYNILLWLSISDLISGKY